MLQKAEPLNIQNERFLVNRLIEQAPTGTMIREFVKNAEENAALAPEGKRRVEIYPIEIDGVRKLAFWNTGVGMTAQELRRVTDLSSSINKAMALDGNFGIGAKVSGLTVSPRGIRYRSCRDGVVNQVMIGYDEEEETYVRFVKELADGTRATVYDITEEAKADGQSTDYDWTEVVLYGESDEHDMCAEPLGAGVKRSPAFIASEIFRRFARFNPGVEVNIDVAMSKSFKNGKPGTKRRIVTLESVIDELPAHERVSTEDGRITVHYIHDPLFEGKGPNESAKLSPASNSTAFCALVHKGERYDYKTEKRWAAIAPEFGIPFGSKVLSIEIEFADDAAMPNQYRDGLTLPADRSQLRVEDFAHEVRKLMPDWVKDITQSEAPDTSGEMDELKADLQGLLNQLSVPLRRPGSTSKLDETAPKEAPEKPAGPVVVEQFPDIQILTDQATVEEKTLTGRAARYYPEARTLFVNGLYPVVERVALTIEAHFADCEEPETMRAEALNAARIAMAHRVGKAICFAMSKRGQPGWSEIHVGQATSPEALSIAADDFTQGFEDSLQRVRAKLSEIEPAAGNDESEDE